MRAEDYDWLPYDGHRRELIDGVLLTQSPLSGAHQRFALRLFAALDLTAPREVVVTQAVEIRISERLRYVPDLLAVTVEGYAEGVRSQYVPRDVILAVEIVSDSSRGMDRILKPNHYAMAGIPHYWRVELDPMRIFTYELHLRGENYVDTGEFDAKMVVQRPWPISLDVTLLNR